MASKAEDVHQIYSRVLERIDRGSANYFVILGVLSRRSEAELRIAAILEELIPKTFDRKDTVTVALVDELTSEVAQHRTFANDLRTKIVSPCTTYGNTMREKHKGIQGMIKRDDTQLAKAITDTKSAQTAVDVERSKLGTMPPNRIDQQNLRIQKLSLDLKKKQANEIAVSQKIQQAGIPALHGEFKEFDASRLVRIQSAVVDFGKLKEGSLTEIVRGVQILQGKMATYDGTDRSFRYLSRVFDTSQGAGEITEEDPDLNAIAVCNYQSDNPLDLRFERGDRIHVLVQHHSGWWDGQLGDKRGLFPKSFVMFESDTSGKPEPIGAVFLVISDYRPKRGGDISLLVGDLVYVEYLQVERCAGYNPRTKGRGWFPLENLERKI
jgi:hypothetical protein